MIDCSFSTNSHVDSSLVKREAVIAFLDVDLAIVNDFRLDQFGDLYGSLLRLAQRYLTDWSLLDVG
jgi:hypothetical protein